MVISGKLLNEDNGSGYSVGQHWHRRLVNSCEYLVGWNGVRLDASNMNHCEPFKKVSRKWLEKNAPDLACYK